MSLRVSSQSLLHFFYENIWDVKLADHDRGFVFGVTIRAAGFQQLMFLNDLAIVVHLFLSVSGVDGFYALKPMLDEVHQSIIGDIHAGMSDDAKTASLIDQLDCFAGSDFKFWDATRATVADVFVEGFLIAMNIAIFDHRFGDMRSTDGTLTRFL